MTDSLENRTKKYLLMASPQGVARPDEEDFMSKLFWKTIKETIRKDYTTTPQTYSPKSQ